jgi:hypothetical protein
MCEVAEIRYVHNMQHPDYPDVLGCGCVCAAHMEEDLVGARQREAHFKANQLRRVRWVDRKWRVAEHLAGWEFLNTDGFRIVVYPDGEAWGARVEHRATSLSRRSKLPYQDATAAKLAALNAMLGMKWRLTPKTLNEHPQNLTVRPVFTPAAPRC